jgi:periplasmic protein TonB
MVKAISLQRCTTFGVSCVIHIALVGAAIAIGRDLVTPKVPAVLMADLTLIELPRLVEAPALGPPAPARPKPEKLTLPKPIATPMPAPVTEPKPVETRTPLPPPPASEPSPPARELAVASAPSTSFEAAGDAPSVQAPVESSRGGSNSGILTPPSNSAAAIPPDGITQLAIPRGGYQVRPSYPSSARRLGIQGMTTLRVYVAVDGRVTEVSIHESAGHSDLDNAAAEAVKRWRFEPARRGAQAVGVWVLLPVEFRLR